MEACDLGVLARRPPGFATSRDDARMKAKVASPRFAFPEQASMTMLGSFDWRMRCKSEVPAT